MFLAFQSLSKTVDYNYMLLRYIWNKSSAEMTSFHHTLAFGGFSFESWNATSNLFGIHIMKKAMLFEQEIQGVLPVWSFLVVCSGVQLLWLVLLPNSCQCTDLRQRVMQVLCIAHSQLWSPPQNLSTACVQLSVQRVRHADATIGHVLIIEISSLVGCTAHKACGVYGGKGYPDNVLI